MNNTTIVTGIWDIKRDTLTEGWSRTFEHYINHLLKLMKSPNNMIIYIEKEYEHIIWEHRDKNNTMVIVRELDWFKSNGEIYNKIQKIRTNENWYKQSDWLIDSTQAKLDMYNPIVMSKMFLMNDAAVMDPFNSSHLVWVDGALTNTVHEGYFWHDNVIDNISKNFNKFSFVSFPYDGKVEIHGFEYNKMCEYADGDVNKVARGGIFGGPKHLISKTNEIYYNLLNNTLDAGFMGTEESLFTIMLYKYPDLFNYYEIEMNGLLSTFFENLKNNNLIPLREKFTTKEMNDVDVNNVGLYVLTYNSPKQFETLIKSFELYDVDFLNKPKKFLINNSLDINTFDQYDELCEKYGFEEIHKENIGICGGRQFIAEHADENNFNYHFFFEDDMFFYVGDDMFCRNGFQRKIDNFYSKTMGIMSNENFDFLKWNFSEFYGDHTRQWAWYNVPQEIRERDFPERPNKTEDDTNKAPHLKFKNIKSYQGLPYANGEIFYSNWPQVVSKSGNHKMFLETKWAHPYEQTSMSYIYQETKKGNIEPAVLLATPTEHNRFDFYPANERREN
jgi:hypothetical protein